VKLLPGEGSRGAGPDRARECATRSRRPWPCYSGDSRRTSSGCWACASTRTGSTLW